MESSSKSISTTEAAARLGVHKNTIRRWCETSGFGTRLGGRWRVSEARIVELERNLSACGTGMPGIDAQQPDLDTLLDRAMDAARQTEAA